MERKHRKTETHVDEEPGGPKRELHRETVVEDRPDGTRLVTRQERRTLSGVAGRPGVAHSRTERTRGVLRPARPHRVLRRERVVPTAWGPARVAAILLGTLFAVVATGEAYLASVGGDYVLGGTRLLVESPVLAATHGIVAFTLLSAGLAHEGPARGMVRVIGFVLAIGALAAMLGRAYFGEVLALNSQLAFPWSHVLLYAAAALVCLACGFAPRMRRTEVDESVEPEASVAR